MSVAFLQRIARKTAGFVGRDSSLIIQLRPLYENVLGGLTGGEGVPWSINGVTYRVDPHCRSSFADEYDPRVASLLREHIRPGAVCLDVGANVGIYVMQLAHWSRPTGRVIAFEPNPGACAILEKHVALNRIGSRVDIVRCAIGARPATAILHAAGSNGMSRLGVPNALIEHETTQIRVEVITLDEYCATKGIVPDVLLIDIEGFEIAALEGAAKLIEARGRDMLIVVEMHPLVWPSAGTTRAQAEALLAKLKLGVMPLTGQTDALSDYGQVRLIRNA